MSVTEFVEEAFINEFGQKIEVGEEVLYAGSSRQSTRIRRGTFKGVRYANITRTEYLKNPDGSYIQYEVQDGYGRTYKRYETKTVTTREVVAAVVRSNRGKQYKWVDLPDGKRAYVKSDIDIFGTSTLLKKRVYKYSTGLVEMEGKSF